MARLPLMNLADKIPLFRPVQPSKEALWEYFQESIDAGQLSNIGPCYIKASERIRGAYTHNCLVANATLGLELATRALYKPGTRVAIPTFTFKATYLAVKNAGCIPVICPVNRNLLIEPETILKAKCKGAIIVAPFGHTINFCDYDSSFPFPIIYDLAGAWGLTYHGQNLAVYSFHATKRMPVGEGGCVVSGNLEVIERVKWLSNFSYTNAKLSELSCAMFLALSDMIIPKARIYDQSLHGQCTASMSITYQPPNYIYELITNPLFTAKRYYYPLIEDMYEAEVLERTPESSHIRNIVAVPRDVSDQEFMLISSILAR